MNIAVVLKAEIARLARKQIKTEMEALKKGLARSRSEVAALKREIAELKRDLKGLSSGKAPVRASASVEDDGAEPIRLRFSAKRLAAHRQRLGLSAENFGKLVGVSGQTIYLWESEKTRPRNGQLQAIAAVRRMGKREALSRLEPN